MTKINKIYFSYLKSSKYWLRGIAYWSFLFQFTFCLNEYEYSLNIHSFLWMKYFLKTQNFKWIYDYIFFMWKFWINIIWSSITNFCIHRAYYPTRSMHSALWRNSEDKMLAPRGAHRLIYSEILCDRVKILLFLISKKELHYLLRFEQKAESCRE